MLLSFSFGSARIPVQALGVTVGVAFHFDERSITRFLNVNGAGDVPES
jgi:hypothetical protein